jgi:hypothetical protein
MVSESIKKFDVFIKPEMSLLSQQKIGLQVYMVSDPV